MQEETGALAKDKMLKLARMELHGVPRKQTAAAMGLSESRISQIIELVEYQSAAEVIAAENFEEQQMINKGWDGIEALGITRVVRALQNDPEPEFALRAAVFANKAARRGGFAQNPISQSAGIRTVINLNSTFVDKLQQNFEIKKDKTSVLIEKQKGSDFLGAKAVQELLQKKPAEDTMQELLAGTSF